MTGDLPDYEKKIVIVTIPGNYPAEMQVDITKVKSIALKTPTVAACIPVSIEHIIQTNAMQILGVALMSPTIAKCLPISLENPAIAYNQGTDRFKVDIEALTVGTIDVNPTDKWARQLGLVDLSRVLGAALAHNNPVISRLTNGSAFIDPRDRNWTITESLARSWTLGDTDIPDLKDRAGRLLGLIANTIFNVGNFPSTYDVSDRAARLLGVISGTATVTQAAKDRTISSVDATATALQVSLTANNGNSAALVTPAGGKALRIKFVSLEHSADVDLGYRFGAAGTIYYLRTTKGLYVSNLVGCNNQGAADAALYINTSGASNIKGYVLYTEV